VGAAHTGPAVIGQGQQAAGGGGGTGLPTVCGGIIGEVMAGTGRPGGVSIGGGGGNGCGITTQLLPGSGP